MQRRREQIISDGKYSTYVDEHCYIEGVSVGPLDIQWISVVVDANCREKQSIRTSSHRIFEHKIEYALSGNLTYMQMHVYVHVGILSVPLPFLHCMHTTV